jgi:hypothetical protein
MLMPRKNINASPQYISYEHHIELILEKRFREGLILRISESSELRQMWAKYQRQFDYAADISYEQIVGVLKALLKNSPLCGTLL